MSHPNPRSLSTALVVLLLLATGPLFGAARAQEPVELLVWDQFTDATQTEVVDSIYQAFEEQNPNVTIRREVVQTQQMQQTLRTALGSGTGPDVVFYDAGPGYAGVLAEAGLLLPLEEMAAQYGWTERIAESARRGATIDGKLYGLPLQVDLIGLWMNKTLMDQEGLQAPETVAQLADLCRQAVEKGYEPPMAFSNNPGWQAYHQFAMTSNNAIGPEAMEALLFEGQGSWNTPEMVGAIDAFFVELRDAGCLSEDANAIESEDGNGLFFTGQSLLHPTGSWLFEQIEENMADYEVEFVPFPALADGGQRVWASGVGSAFFVSAGSQKQAEAGAFLDYLFSPAATTRWTEEARFLVPVQIDPAAVEVSPLFRSLLEILGSAAGGQTKLGYNIDVLTPPRFNEAMLTGFQAILAGDKTPEQQAADLQAAWEADRAQ